MTKLVNLEVGDKVQLTSYGKFWEVLKDFNIGDVFIVENKVEPKQKDIYILGNERYRVSTTYTLRLANNTYRHIDVLENMLSCFGLVETGVNIEHVIQKLERDFFEILTGKRKENTVAPITEDIGGALKKWTKSMNINNIGVSQVDADEAIDILKDIDNKKTPYEQIALMHNITVEELQDILLTFDNGDGDVLSLMSQRLNYEE